jgi:hypothetical protein
VSHPGIIVCFTSAIGNTGDLKVFHILLKENRAFLVERAKAK